MNTNKHSSAKAETPNSKLQKSSVIFMQLGLIVALFAVYLALEYKFLKKQPVFFEPETVAIVDTYVPDKFNVVDPKKNPPVKTTIKKVKIIKPVIDKVNVIENTKTVTTELPKDLVPIDDDELSEQPTLQESDIPSVDLIDENPDENVDFVKVEIKPTFYKCQNKKGKAKDICFTKTMQKYISKNFDSDLAHDLGLTEGKHRIYVQFVIDKNGDIINVHSNAVHPKLKKEAERVVKKLPKMIPGKQRTHFVNVKYNLPISFIVE